MGLISFYWLVFAPSTIFTFRQVPQLWRLLTTFVLTGPKLGMILDPYFLYTYGSALETTAVRFSGPGDFFVYLVFVCCVILVSWPFFFYCISPAPFHSDSRRIPAMQEPRISARPAHL